MPAAANQFKTMLALDSVAAHKRSLGLGSNRPGQAQESASFAQEVALRQSSCGSCFG